MSKFKRPPLTEKEKEKFINEFIENAPRQNVIDRLNAEKEEEEEKKVIYLRIPKSLDDNLLRIAKFTGFKKNAFCMHVIMEAVKDKLKQIEREIS